MTRRLLVPGRGRVTLVRAAVRMASVAVGLMGVARHGLGQDDAAVPAAWRGAPDWPSWCRPAKVMVPSSKPWVVFRDSRRGATQMRQASGPLRYLATHAEGSANRPYWMLQLGRHLADLEEDQAAYAVLADVLALPGDTTHNSALYGYPTLASVKREGALLQARVLARSGHVRAARAVLADWPAENGYEHTRHAEILALCGDAEAALESLGRADESGHPERQFSHVFVPMRVVTLAHILGDEALAAHRASALLDRGMRSQRWPQWQSAWYVMHQTVDLGKAGAPPAVRELRDGTFTGSCRGFIGGIDVDVRITAGRITDVTVVREREDRSWSSITIIPQRIVRHQRLLVDAVTGATVTSCAIVAAAEEALRKADGG